MNYYKYKLKKMFYKSVFKISIIKKWYIGHELLKNMPSVNIPEGIDVDGLEFQNTIVKLNGNNHLSNCELKNTVKLSQYF